MVLLDNGCKMMFYSWLVLTGFLTVLLLLKKSPQEDDGEHLFGNALLILVYLLISLIMFLTHEVLS